MRERGLKQGKYDSDVGQGLVAPHAGAWIETLINLEMDTFQRSLPMRERGLKLVDLWPY